MQARPILLAVADGPRSNTSIADHPWGDLDSPSVEPESARLQVPLAAPALDGVRSVGAQRLAFCGCVAVGVAIAVLACFRFSHEAALSAGNPAAAAAARIPAGACVLTDVSSLTIVADRFFANHRACDQLVDSIGTDYALAGGRNALVGAGRTRGLRQAWLAAFERAQFVWFDCAPVTSAACAARTARRIPWTPTIAGYFRSHFHAEPGQPQFLFVRDQP